MFGVFRNHPFQIKIPQTWYLVWGDVSVVPEATWQDEKIAIFDADNFFAISPSERFLIVGNVWLSDRQNLSPFALSINICTKIKL